MHNASRIYFRLLYLVAVALGINALIVPANAMTSRTVEKTCPYDGTKFSANLQGSGSSVDATLDLMPVGAIISPWPLAICPTNGFVFFKSKFDGAELAKLRPFVLSDEYQAMRRESAYYRAAWLLDHLDASHWDVTWALVQATWERPGYVSKVIERLPQDISEAGDDRKIDRSLLYGEFLRQLGRFHDAEHIFSDILEKTDPFSNQGLIARYEITLIKAGDSSNRHMQSDAIKMFENDADYKRASRIPNVLAAAPLRQSVVAEPDGLNFPWIMLKRLVWSDDANTVFANTNGGIVAIDANSGNSLQSRRFACLECTFGATEILLSAGRSAFILVGSAAGGHASLKMLDAKTLGETTSHDFQNFLSPALLSFDRKAIIYDIGSDVELRDIQTDEARSLGRPLGPMMGRGHYWFLKAADPSGPRLAIYFGLPTEKFKMVIWDYSTNTKVQELNPETLENLAATEEAAFSSDGKHLYLATDVFKKDVKEQCEVSLWDTHTGQSLIARRMEGGRARLSISSDGRYVAMACGQFVSLWTSDLGRSVATIAIHGSGWFPSVAFSPDSKKFAVHTGDAIVIYTITE